MLKCMARVCPFTFLRSRRGSTLVEVMIAIAVLGLITSSVLPVFIMLNKAEFKWTQQTVAESLIRAQIEFIKGWPYVEGNSTNSIADGNIEILDPSNPDFYPIVKPPDDTYRIEVIAKPILIDATTTPGNVTRSYLPAGQYENDQPQNKKGIQEITVTVYHIDTNGDSIPDKQVTSVTNYKVNR